MPDLVTEEEQVARTLQWDAACEEIVDVRQSMDVDLPDIPAATKDRVLAELIITNNLGEEWAKKHLDGPGTGDYLRKNPGDSLERHERYFRTLHLARWIFELGQEGFAERLMENLRRRDLEGAVFEAEVVRMLITLPVHIHLREELGPRATTTTSTCGCVRTRS